MRERWIAAWLPVYVFHQYLVKNNFFVGKAFWVRQATPKLPWRPGWYTVIPQDQRIPFSASCKVGNSKGTKYSGRLGGHPVKNHHPWAIRRPTVITKEQQKWFALRLQRVPRRTGLWNSCLSVYLSVSAELSHCIFCSFWVSNKTDPIDTQNWISWLNSSLPNSFSPSLPDLCSALTVPRQKGQDNESRLHLDLRQIAGKYPLK